MRVWQIVVSFHCALRGILFAMRTQMNMKIHLGLAVLSIAGGLFFRIDRIEWLAVLLAIGLVFCAEMFNTVIEIWVSAMAPEHSVTVKRVKDLSAGAVLIAAIAALCVAFLVFPRRIFLWLGWWG